MRTHPFLLLPLVLLCFSAMAQQPFEKDTLRYQKKQLIAAETDFISSYYAQDGNNSAVTGGRGTESLTDVAISGNVSRTYRDRKGNEHAFNIGAGIDFYSSASSDKIDPATISSASKSDVRFSPSVSYAYTDTQKKRTTGATFSVSNEYDYTSFGLGLTYAKASKDNNREFNMQGQVYLDTWRVILPIELRSTDTGLAKTEPRNSYSASFSLSQVLGKRLQVSLMADVVYQEGLLSTPYQRVYFADTPLSKVEKLPGSRFKLPVGMRVNYFLSDFLVLRGYYRYYYDEWGLSAHTISLEPSYKINSFFSVYPFYRYYTQTAIDYFGAYQTHQSSQAFYTSDYDLSGLDSHFVGMGIRFGPPEGLFGYNLLGKKQYAKMFELRYGHYSRSNGLVSNIISLQMKFGRK